MLALRSPDGSDDLELLPEVGGRIHRLRIDGRRRAAEVSGTAVSSCSMA